MAILLLADGLGVLLDCGPTTLVALKKLGLSPSDIDVILLSHHHGDHFAGVPFLVLHECYQGSRTKPLVVYGPDGTREKLTQGLESLFQGSTLCMQCLNVAHEQGIDRCHFVPEAGALAVDRQVPGCLETGTAF